MQIDPYLVFDGRCREAFTFYEQLFGGKIEMLMTHAESPMGEKTAPEWRDKIIHVRLKVGDRILMGSDAPPQHFQQPQGFSISIITKDIPESERFFKALSDGGHIQMPLQKTFWSASFGMLVDRFGIPWMVNCAIAS